MCIGVIFSSIHLHKNKVLFLSDVGSTDNLMKNDKYFSSIQKKLSEQGIAFKEIIFPFNIQKKRESGFELEKLLCLSDFFYFKNNRCLQNYCVANKVPLYKQYLYFVIYRASLRILKKIKPSVIVLTCYYSSKYPFIVAAKELGIITVELQHGNFRVENRNYFFSHITYVLPDYLLVGSIWEREKILSLSNLGSFCNVLSLGQPRFDKYFNNDLKDICYLEEGLELTGKKVLFWPTQTHGQKMIASGENFMNADLIFKTISSMVDWFLIIKLHPNEDQKKSFEFYSFFAEKYSLKRVKIFLSHECGVHALLKICTATVVKHSTVGLESLLIGKPVINLNLRNSYSLENFEVLKTKLFIQKPADLKKALDIVVSDKYFSSFLAEREKFVTKNFSYGGISTFKVVDFIKKLI